MSRKRLILLELNEVNFDVARSYVEPLGLKHFAELFRLGVRRTTSEERYEELEPWIQWVSAHSGLSASEHGIFRLGDIVGRPVPQIFETLEHNGLQVGAISPMNAENRLARPSYFIPDPWTDTPSDGSFWGRNLSQAVSQAVNDNASSRLTLRSAATLLAGLVRFARPSNYALYAWLAATSRSAPWRKALFLDVFLNDLHRWLYRSRRPDFSSLFLNAGAHIQHHYFFNSIAVRNEPGVRRNPHWYVRPDADPMADMLRIYDRILGEYLSMPDTSVMVATGLTQRPYTHLKFYYRLRDHADFLGRLGIRYRQVFPRMTRDFLIEFDDAADAARAVEALSALRASTDGLPIFGELDNRGTSVFVTLTYPHEITPALWLVGGPALRLADHVAFVAIKNGMHASHGYVSCKGAIETCAPADGAHVKSLHGAILAFFGIGGSHARSGLEIPYESPGLGDLPRI